MPGMFTLQMERKELLSDLEIVERSNFCQQGLDRKLTFVFFVAQQGNEHYFYFVKVTKCKLIINMSLKANIAIVLHLHSFKNLALPHKARYALRTTIYQGKNQKVTAMPFNIIETETKPKKNVSSQGELQDILFLSKRFNIQYQEQQIQLNDCCQFRLTLQSFPQLKDEDLYLEFTLVENVSCYFREQINSKVELKEVESYRFKLQNIATGIFRYCQGQFSKAFISSFSFTFFAMITDYRFHPYTARAKSDSPKQKARQRVENIEQLMKWAEKYLKNSDDGSRYFYQHYVKDLRYNSFCIQSEVNSCLRKSKGEIYPKVPTGEGGELVTVNDKQFFDYVTSYFPEKISQGLIKLQIHRINQQNFYFLQNLGNAMSKGGIDMKLLRQKFRTQRRDLFGERVFRSVVFGKAAKDKDHNNKTASKMRKKKKINELKIIDQHLFMKKQNQHYAFIQVNLPHSLKTKEYQNGSIDQVLKELTQLRNSEQKEEISYDQRNMLVVLVHGFQATSYDMEIIRRQLMRKLPVAMFLNSTANEHDTTGDIELMGKKLADEIKSYINRFIDNQNEVIINLVGHSMGGIIARAALPYLQAFQKQLGFYLSLSSPHIGYINGVDLKIKAGLWFMRKTNKILSLDQLSMQEKQSMKQTFLYKLSSSGHLLNFKKVILLSSSEDSYVPWHSARIEYYDGSGSGSKLEKQMVENILGDQIVHRIDIHFDIQTTKDINSFIGRAAHINLLTQQSILKLVNEAIPNLFEYKQL